MAAEVHSLAPLKVPRGPATTTPEQAHWRSFKYEQRLPSLRKAHPTSITAPGKNPNGEHADTFAVTGGNIVQIFNNQTRELAKTITRFNVEDSARSGVLRRDGKILLAGGDSGIVQAFDTGSRAILRQWRGPFAHQLPVHMVRWSPYNLTEWMSTSDDRSVRLWDLTEDEPKWTGADHQDYVRCGTYLPDQVGIIISGSYDQTVRLWDVRQQKAAMTFKHHAPVENVLALNSMVVASAAGNKLSILNLAAGKASHVIQSHQKTVTSLSLARNGHRLLTGGLDRHVKVHDTTSWQVVAGIKYSSPVLSMSVIQREGWDRHLAVGLEEGIISLRMRLAPEEKTKLRKKEARMKALISGEADEYERKEKKKDLRQGIRARDRGKDFKGKGADIIINGNYRSKQSRKKLRDWQKSLRTGKYGLALDQVLEPRGRGAQFSNQDVLMLIIALRFRSALRTALSGRTDERLVPVFAWCLKYMTFPRNVGLIHDVLLLLIDLHKGRMPKMMQPEKKPPRTRIPVEDVKLGGRSRLMKARMAEIIARREGKKPGQKQGQKQDEKEMKSGARVMEILQSIERRAKLGLDYAQSAHTMLGMIDVVVARQPTRKSIPDM